MKSQNNIHKIISHFISKILVGIMCLLLLSKTISAGVPDTLFQSPSVNFKFDSIPDFVSDQDEIRAGLLYDYDRQKIVWQKDMDYAYPIASLTKMMVGLLAVEDIEAGKISLDDRITVTRSFKKRISRRKYSCVSSDEHYTMEDLLKMAMVASHNESTVWIANHCSGDIPTFVGRMNHRAQELGMTKTMYSNTSGLPAIMNELDNSASPHDLLILALEVLKHPKLMEITGISYTTISNGKGSTQYHNHNGLVINYNQEVDGIKTGYTRNARFCLVATAHRGEHRLISIVLGVRSPWVRNGVVASMMNTYFDAMKLGRLGDAAPDMLEAKAFMDSVKFGLTHIRPNIEQKHSKDSSEELYAFTYKTVETKIKKPLTVRHGENIGRIANKYNVAVADIKKWNHLRSSSIHTGQRLYVYTTLRKRVQVKLVVDPDEPYADSQPAVESNECGPTVQHDNSIVASTIVKNTNDVVDTTPEKVEVKHNEKKQRVDAAIPDEQTQKFIYHTVQPGDTLWNIAQRYQASMDQIKRVNRIGNGRMLKSGTRIKIPVNRG